ncbi:ankyrin repeat and SOCS box 2-like protein [Labeo rohita]|uniref:Ankyrin repeat and SOCS box 2-like protein n=1 Tax=Labeo rohita TaxID=84645 RepID=A0A498MX90_LABRO|nr:ankyrin repeat and SOCS box protein 2b [Labeo rohita]RXN22846.1 ankyrin repeat and SOCS box 2-like protein [Labeo rohita]
MTRFSYAEYIALFRSSDTKRNSSAQKSTSSSGRAADRDDAPTDPSEMICAVRRAHVQPVSEACDSDDWTALHEAAHRGQTHCVQALLKDPRVCVDKRTLQEQTPLLLAVHGRHLDCVRSLLEAGADPDINNKNKETPLYKACEQECISTVRLLLAFGATVNQRCYRGCTALHEAARRDNAELCETLLQARAAVDARNADDVTPAIEAARHGRTQTLAYLIRNGAGVNVQTCDGNTALTEACRHGHGETVKLLLKHHADANRATAAGLLPLHIASQHGHKEIVSLLLPITSRARIRQSGISPLHLAAEHDRQLVMSLLIESGFDVNSKLSHERSARYHDRRVSALFCAVAARNTQAAAVLLKAGADPNVDPFSPLLLAARHGCLKTVAVLVEHGAHVNARPPGPTAGFPAVLLYAHQLDVLQYLLDNGCDAQACFTCDRRHSEEDANFRSHASQRNTSCTKTELQFCDWISSSCWRHSAGQFIDLLLDYVGNVQLCSRIRDLLLDKQEWTSIKEKTSSPRALMHLCRLKIREQLGTQRLRSVHSLPLPDRMLRYLSSRSSSRSCSIPHFHGHAAFAASACV